MRRKLFLLLLVALPFIAHAQSYTDDILDWQDWYKGGLLLGSHPLKPSDTQYVRFFAPDERYKVTATFVLVTGAKPFLMANKHGGTRRAVREYGYVYFNLMGAALTMVVYRFTNMERPDINGGLFIPFTDRTNYDETFQGGRYLDVAIDSIHDNLVVLDFNKAYNPHTAYEKGYPYMITPAANDHLGFNKAYNPRTGYEKGHPYILPPVSNNLRVEINAGEKIFGHNPGY